MVVKHEFVVNVKPNIDLPRWDQKTYWGRAKHFFTITNPLNIFCSNAELEKSKKIVEDYRSGKIEETLTLDQLWRAKNIFDSAYHPETKEKMVLIGRMSAQVPMNMIITGCMLTFYKTPPQVIFWQWVNQSFNAVVNYTNRSGKDPVSVRHLVVPYLCATSGALITALSLNNMVRKLPPLFGRFVPFAAVAAANCVNIPLMRVRELHQGITVVDEKGVRLGESTVAARSAISMVVLSRILMAVPGMFIPPVIMNSLEKKPFFAKNPNLGAPIQIGMCGFFLAFATPMCCALFPQMSSIDVKHLEKDLQAQLKQGENAPKVAYYNKGL